MDGFSSRCFTVVKTAAAEQKELANYPYVERYDPTKTYEKDKFTAAYANDPVPRKYEFSLFEIKVEETDETHAWVVAEENVPEEELRQLSPFCQCYICKHWWPLRLILRCFVCACCVGCLYTHASHYASPRNVAQARRRVAACAPAAR